MTDVASYSFLPWTRRGLAATLPVRQATTPPPSVAGPIRSGIRVAARLNTGQLIGAPDMALYGPGDVLGLDPQMITRTEPTAGSTCAAANYLAAIDFATPDLPWVLTPGEAAGPYLRPWLVLIVLESHLAGSPRMLPDHPLPCISLPASRIVSELPDLAESWAWAHTQVTVMKSNLPSTTAPVQGELTTSRLICPRKLSPAAKYVAYLVPAFKQGVQRGLGLAVDPQLAPAWCPDGSSDLVLPVYFHWSFRTSEDAADSDFESMAKRIKGVALTEPIGYEFCGLIPAEYGGQSNSLSLNDAHTQVEGALRSGSAMHAPYKTSVPSTIRQGIVERLNAPADRAAQGPALAGVPIGPPIYGGAHTNINRIVPAVSPAWLETLNVDPRLRIAAGLGAEVVRANQDTFMQACWEQLGDVLQANAILNRGRLARELGVRLMMRFFERQGVEHLLSIVAPIHNHLRYNALTIRALIQGSSLPDQIGDPALRRLLSPRRPVIRAAMGRSDHIAAPNLWRELNQPRANADPLFGVPDGLLGSRILTQVAGDNFARVGFEVTVSSARDLRSAAQRATFAASHGLPALAIRPTLASQGVVLPEHVNAASAVVAQNPGQTLTGMVTAWVQAKPAPFPLLSTGADGRPLVVGLELRGPLTPGSIVSITLPTSTGTGQTVGKVAVTAGGLAAERIGQSIDPHAIQQVLWPGAPGLPVFRVAPPLNQEGEVVSAFTTAFEAYQLARAAERQPVTWDYVTLPLSDLKAAALQALDPEHTVMARVRSRIESANHAWDGANQPRMRVSPEGDRIWAYPSLPEPLYTYLAHFDVQRFLPGAAGIPENAVVGLVTNPAFVEAFLVGANHEMNRELLWRGFPTEPRGTVFQTFWAWTDGRVDIDPIHTWKSSHSLDGASPVGGQLVLLIRGDLIAYHPGTVVMVIKGASLPNTLGKLAEPVESQIIKYPEFSGRLDPDFLFFGFDLSLDVAKREPWFLVLQEQPTEPRFGLDKPPEPSHGTKPGSWQDATWADVTVTRSGYLDIAQTDGKTKIGGFSLSQGAAHLAAALYQRPLRAAYYLPRLLK